MTRLLFFFVFTSLFGCNFSFDREDIIGNWKVVSASYPKFTSDPVLQSNYESEENAFYIGSRYVIRENGVFEQPDDEFDNSHSKGYWDLQWNQLIVDYSESEYGGEVEYSILDVTDSTLTLLDEDITLLLTKLPFYRPKNDTIIFTHIASNPSYPLFQIYDVSNNQSPTLLKSVKDSTSYFIRLKNPNLTNYALENYDFNIEVGQNGVIHGTWKKGQYELFVNKDALIDSLEIIVSLEYDQDSIIALGYNQTATSSPDTTFTFPTLSRVYIPIE